ncbi:hypothetical protein [Bacillus sp. FJAT-27245]|uniref:hypothetical protein n=1 Tax=Bacillus sp. FJAT-27245 TaxID=1684144 RepID=UPI0006A77175|nr:hypothetical protein [Bacillus sp. FJAT-27245]
MATTYTDEQNHVFLEVMDEYRRRIEGASPKETERLTRGFAKGLINTVPLLDGRSENGIAERLVYFDNLLAGVTFPFDYYLKSTFHFFGKLPRKSGVTKPNNWKTQHEARREKEYKKSLL